MGRNSTGREGWVPLKNLAEVISVTHRDGITYQIRLATEADVPALRQLVNAAYKELSDMGLNYTATYQDEGKTLERLNSGRCFVLLDQDEIIGTINLIDENRISDRKCAYLGQFGIRPELKRNGLGTLLMEFVEKLAREENYACAQLDTAKPAEHLVTWYQSRGYKIVSETHFEGKTYDSWIFEKELG